MSRLALLESPGAPAIARRFVDQVAHELDEAQARDALLLTGELVTNAVRYAGGAIDITVMVADGRLRIEVHDSSPIHPHPTIPSSHGGYGLHIVDHVSDRWGVIPYPPGKIVWAELDLVPATW
jgi:anti-sigma regulatory factor (Ser/Thr protein kinase)